jgi:hypothetical protein
MPVASAPFPAECARCGFRYIARQTDFSKPDQWAMHINIAPWPPCPKCGHPSVYAVEEVVA